MANYRRFYLVENHSQGFSRTRHGHRREGKAVVVLQGAAIVPAVNNDDWDDPSREVWGVPTPHLHLNQRIAKRLGVADHLRDRWCRVVAGVAP